MKRGNSNNKAMQRITPQDEGKKEKTSSDHKLKGSSMNNGLKPKKEPPSSGPDLNNKKVHPCVTF